MNSDEVECIIYADCLTEYSKEDVQILIDNFGLYEYDKCVDYFKEIHKRYNTFRCIITDKVYYKLSNRYRIPDDTSMGKYWNKQYAEEEGIGLHEYLTVEEIKQLTYYEYGDEHIHSIRDQGKYEEIEVNCRAKDLALVSKRLKEYLLNTEEQALKFDKKYVGELQKLELMSSIASKYNSDFLLIHHGWDS